MQVNESTSSGSSQLVGGVPLVSEAQEGVMELEVPRLNAARLHVDDKSRPNLLQEEEEEVGPHLLLQSVWEEQIQMIILPPVSQAKVTGIGDAGKKTGTGKIELAHISFYRCECRCDL